jgi:hypothetical protein
MKTISELEVCYISFPAIPVGYILSCLTKQCNNYSDYFLFKLGSIPMWQTIKILYRNLI